MARKVVLTSDMSGDTGVRTIEFSFDGVGYEIDLTEAEAKQFRKDLAPLLRCCPGPQKREQHSPTPSTSGLLSRRGASIDINERYRPKVLP